jgi:predicted ATP-grasp superfamily ATP-dependent carboligase
MRALIVGSESARGALAASRALTASGWIVGFGSPRRGPAGGSRSIHRMHAVPPPHDLKTFVKAVNAAIVAGGYEVIFGAGDAEVLALSALRKSVRGIVPYAEHDKVLRALDKVRLMEAAAAAGLDVPPSVEPTEDALRAARYPLIVKAGSHWLPDKATGPARVEARRVGSPDEAISVIEGLRQKASSILVQEVVEGDLLAYTCLVDEAGKVVVDVQQRADRLWPPGSGVSVRATTERVDEELRNKIAPLLADLGWFGLAQLQFLAAEDGIAYLIDLNGRFYGSLSLALAAGCDVASAWANLATERPIEVADARPGVRYQWLEGDLRRALVERRGGRLADIVSCFRFARGAAHSVWSPRDPVPALSSTGSLASRAVRKTFR